ncbi:MAG: polyribonucleotide nucleotidyltransferase [Candidatus Omnitrophica bacterium]|nr:polyribonucleotide nucleotidyltransferase [Candidatus Omnitrophota bacterium]
MNSKNSEMTLGRNRLIARTGHVARQASGAVTLQLGDSMILVTVCGAKEPREGQDFFPLTVEYQEKTYAGGMIPGGFFKREGRATEKEILTSRLTDRPIRPLFPEGYRNEVQIVATVLSSDGENDPDMLSINGASMALLLSDVPFLEPVGAVRVAEVEGQFVVNPTYEELKKSTLDIVVAGTKDGITMIESEAKEISEERITEALKFAHAEIRRIVDFQAEFAAGIAKEKALWSAPEVDADLESRISAIAVDAFRSINEPKTKEARQEAIDQLKKELCEKFVTEGGSVTKGAVLHILEDIEYTEVRKFYLTGKRRVDGRALDEIRKIECEVGVLPRTHGSGLFTRGQTQSLGIATLGTAKDEQLIESYQGTHYKNFMLHYNFPPYSVGEVKMMRGPGRREIGHGALARRGLSAVVPTKEEFPYTIRLVSDILESNGSSSMASVCSGTLALMDAGVPIKAPVSGIAMGLIKEGADWVVLSDIAGVEDHLGDMDFKVAGTAKGITTLQLDIKLKEGIDFGILVKALEQAKAGRSHILNKMLEVISAPRQELSRFAPRIIELKINPERIGEVIGPGGKMIRRIQSESGADINIEDDGTVRVASRESGGSDKAIQMIREITQEAEVGKIYKATVTRLMDFGAFCEIMPGKEGLAHISELSDSFVDHIDDVVAVGDQFDVKVIEVDRQGRVNLSAKAVKGLIPHPDPNRPPRERRPASRQQRPRNDKDQGSRPKRSSRF